jgi:undecaprenyl-diphosphatase
VLALAAFGEVADDVFRDPLEGDAGAHAFDRAISGWIIGFRSLRLTQVMTDLTALGSFTVMLTLFVVLVSVLASYRDFKGLGYLSVVLLGAGAWPFLLKPVFGRPRPDPAGQLAYVADLSFPSGHSFAAASVYIALAYYSAQYTRSWGQEVFFYGLGATVILAVGVSRIYLGMHYPTDVLAGLSGGAAWALLASAVFEWLAPTRRRQGGGLPRRF